MFCCFPGPSKVYSHPRRKQIHLVWEPFRQNASQGHLFHEKHRLVKTQDDNPKSLVSIHYVAIVFGFALPTNAWTETDMSEHDKHMLLRVFRTHPVQVWAFLWKVRWAFVVRRWPWLGKRLRGLETIFVVEPGGEMSPAHSQWSQEPLRY
jgi:hypothetical protein